ncbi:3-deoxy-D-manno-octulosonic-acid transferase [Bartonella australis AUST/NH1]|uniref:3-deoxy-D-manno-octulosonic acid transferase n=1 Tax=Bartonella australis (strain Aust/NH1) TaxID=1094489 RepID=M1P2Q1_BARAA|nr:lipid IV(A) 3-deoxy-D-manno-octulosonic acid transferase [Bartonella australis]AGF74085.1 3-deoxy-D-manno-octulosonic-acid transferase [Bartonella australis AUST/NH1]
MMQLTVRTAFSIYRVVSFCLGSVVPLCLFLRVVRGKEEPGRQKERLGKSDIARPPNALIWVHAASVGETLSLFPLINHILSLKINILFTTGTVNSSTLVKKHFGNRLIHQYAPLDLESAVRRFICHWKPDLALVCESEIWPLRIKELAKMRIPQILVNARMSERSFKVWKKWLALARYIFGHINMAICQNEKDVTYYRALGVKSVVFSGNLKADVSPTENSALLMHYRDAIGDRPTWAAVSTHEGEEKIAFEVHKTLKNHLPNLLTIIVPRYPERSGEILRLYSEEGVNCVRRSNNAVPVAETDILLGDTIGEMGLFLRLSKVSFIGKSLCRRGGHNPLESALLGSAILTGPHVANFQDMFEKFVSCDAAYMVEDMTRLAFQVNRLLTDEASRQEMVDRAYKVATSMAGAFERTLKVLHPFLQPLVIQTSLSQCRSGYAC